MALSVMVAPSTLPLSSMPVSFLKMSLPTMRLSV
jgi:hypothetical protein